jgi:hypothetical protein
MMQKQDLLPYGLALIAPALGYLASGLGGALILLIIGVILLVLHHQRDSEAFLHVAPLELEPRRLSGPLDGRIGILSTGGSFKGRNVQIRNQQTSVVSLK